MKCNEAGLNIIREFESFSPNAYLCPAGVWTIGYGHTQGVKKGDKITQEIGERLLIQDVTAAEKSLARIIRSELNENQWSALVSLAFNVGANALIGTNTLRMINTGKMMDAANALLSWNKAKGKVLPGLTRRREAERALFLRPAVVK